MSKRTELVQAIRTARTLSAQALAVQALDDYDRNQRLTAEASRAWDAAGAVVQETLTPVRVHEHHTAATDWIGEVDTTGGNYHTEIVAQASAWYGRVPDMVKADADEFAEQAKGMARREAGRFGEQAPAAAQTFLDYVAYLHSKTAASGLDQIDQVIDPNNAPKATPYPTEVFDNFAAPVDPINEGVDESAQSYRAPLLQDIEQKGSGTGTPEKPNEHSTGDDFSDSYAEVPLGEPGKIPTTGALHDGPSVAIGYTMSLDDWKRERAAREESPNFTEASVRHTAPGGGEHAPYRIEKIDGRYFVVNDKGEKKEGKGYASKEEARQHQKALYANVPGAAESAKKEGASQLDQVQQRVDSFENPHPTPLPQDVMFPLVPGFGGQGDGTPEEPEEETRAQASRRAYVARLLEKNPRELSATDRAEIQDYLSTVAGLRKRADEWTAPHNTTNNNEPIANSADTTPQPATGGESKGFADGQADRAAGERPAFSDASSGASPYVQGYSKGYAAGGQDGVANPDVPYSMGGDSGQAANSQEARNAVPLNMAKKTASAMFTTDKAHENADFAKGYKWASTWTPKTAMVRVGSKAFESGVYAGITDNPAQQKAWVMAHRKAAKKHRAPELMRRISLHERVTRKIARKDGDVPIKGFYVQAATSTDLLTDGPGTSPDPMGGTPINGPGTPPPLEGHGDAAAPGGPAPYQGAPPYGNGPVAPDAVMGEQQPEGPQDTSNYGPGYSNPRAYEGDPRKQQIAFRQRVQASLEQMRKAS